MLFTFVGKFFLFFSSFFDEKGKTRKNIRTGKQNGLKFLIFQLNRTKNQLKKKFSRLAARAVIESHLFLQKNPFYDFLAGNNYLDSPHLQGVWHLPNKFHLYLIFRLLCFDEYPNINYRVVHYIRTETKIISLSDNQFKRKKSCKYTSCGFQKSFVTFCIFWGQKQNKGRSFFLLFTEVSRVFLHFFHNNSFCQPQV